MRECLPRRQLAPTGSRWWETGGEPNRDGKVKADGVGEELVRCTRRAAGVGGVALQDRRAEQSRDGPRDQLWVARAARTPSIRQGHEGEVGGPGIRAWAHRSGAGGQRLRSAGALGEGGSVRSQRPGRRAWETASTPVERSEQQTATRTAYARHRLSRESRGKASRRHAFVSNRTGEIPPSGMREGDPGNGCEAPRLRPTRPLFWSEIAGRENAPLVDAVSR
jgi:hypothetical protein